MARVTVEDCLDKVENRFELVMLGSKRARQLAVGGKQPFVAVENDKPTVVALREIAQGYINAKLLHEIDIGAGFDETEEDLNTSLIKALSIQVDVKKPVRIDDDVDIEESYEVDEAAGEEE